MSGTTKGTAGIKPTLIEEGTEIKGNIASSCPIVVMGKIEDIQIGVSPKDSVSLAIGKL